MALSRKLGGKILVKHSSMVGKTIVEINPPERGESPLLK